MRARPYDEAGNADSTIAVIERYLAITPGARMEASTGSGAVNLPTGKGPSRVTRTSIVL